MEIRVAVTGATSAGRLVQRLSGELGTTFVSLAADRSEVRIDTGEESGDAVVRLLNAVEEWLDLLQDRQASVWLDGAPYSLTGHSRDGRPLGPIPQSARDLRSTELIRLAALETENAQLRAALERRVVIEQAKGVLIERHAIDPAAAFELLRAAARTTRRAAAEVAAEIVASPRASGEIADLATRPGVPAQSAVPPITRASA
jgi:ANTAR domain-containing protein